MCIQQQSAPSLMCWKVMGPARCRTMLLCCFSYWYMTIHFNLLICWSSSSLKKRKTPSFLSLYCVVTGHNTLSFFEKGFLLKYHVKLSWFIASVLYPCSHALCLFQVHRCHSRCTAAIPAHSRTVFAAPQAAGRPWDHSPKYVSQWPWPAPGTWRGHCSCSPSRNSFPRTVRGPSLCISSGSWGAQTWCFCSQHRAGFQIRMGHWNVQFKPPSFYILCCYSFAFFLWSRKWFLFNPLFIFIAKVIISWNEVSKFVPFTQLKFDQHQLWAIVPLFSAGTYRWYLFSCNNWYIFVQVS